MDPWSILSMLRACYARDESDDALLPLCTAAAAELEASLRNDADPADIRLIRAAAAAVQHQLCLRALHSADGVDTFKAGDVTVSISAGALCEAAERELRRTMLAVTPLLRDEEFLFRQVTI